MADRLPCLACGAWAKYYDYDQGGRRWPENTTWRAIYCPSCYASPDSRNGNNSVYDDGDIMWLRRIGRRPNVPECTQCGDKDYSRHESGLCKDCRGANSTTIAIRQCALDICPEGVDGQPAWMICGGPRTRPGYLRLDQKYCSQACCTTDNKRRYARRRANRLRDRSARKKLRRREQRLRVAYLHHYRCALCSRLIDVSLPAGHPKALEIDHIVPVSEGGRDVIDNLRPLHRDCHQGRPSHIEDALFTVYAEVPSI